MQSGIGQQTFNTDIWEGYQIMPSQYYHHTVTSSCEHPQPLLLFLHTNATVTASKVCATTQCGCDAIPSSNRHLSNKSTKRTRIDVPLQKKIMACTQMSQIKTIGSVVARYFVYLF